MRQRGFTLIVYAIAALAILAALGGIYAAIYSSGKTAGKAEIQGKWDEANAVARKREQDASTKAAKALAAEREKRKVITKEVVRHVDREVSKVEYRDICLPDRGLCLANAAILGEVPAGCFADGAVPPVKPAG